MGLIADGYCIARAESSDDLVIQVNSLIAEGWQPQGGPMLLYDFEVIHEADRTYVFPFRLVFYQAMVKNARVGVEVR